MRFNSVIISSLFVASSVLAGLHRNGVEGRTDDALDVVYNYNWAGVVLDENAGSIYSISGSFEVPHVLGNNGSGGVIWIGIDGATCRSALLQTGIMFTITPNGTVYQAGWEWVPGPVGFFTDTPISAGDVVIFTIVAYNAVSGFVKIENLTTNQTGIQYLQSHQHPLCRQNAEWIVEPYFLNGAFVPLADFGTLTFGGALATGRDSEKQIFLPQDPEASIWEIEEMGQQLTSVVVGDEGKFAVAYTGSTDRVCPTNGC